MTAILYSTKLSSPLVLNKILKLLPLNFFPINSLVIELTPASDSIPSVADAK
jgi:hypothetical protein